MFGIIRPCRHRLGGELREAWQAHLCGMCLALRDDHGQLARIATNYDGLLISVLTEAQAPLAEARPDEAMPGRRMAGPCPLRGMRRASVAIGDCARLAATVSLVLAAAKIRDHAADGDPIAGRPGLRIAAGWLARRWEERGEFAGRTLGFDTSVLTDAVTRQEALEAAAGRGTPILAITEPTETATAAAFAATATLAGRPRNAGPLAEAGRLFGRIAHLIDAVEDQAADAGRGAWNPVTATGTPISEVRRLCTDAVAGIRLALADAAFTDRRLVDVLLGDELRRSVRRALGAGHAPHCSVRPDDVARQHGSPRGNDAHRTHTTAHQHHAHLHDAAGSLLVPVTRLTALAGLTATGLCASAGRGPYPEERRRRRGDGCWSDCCCDCCGESCCESCDCCDCDCCGGCCDCSC